MILMWFWLHIGQSLILKRSKFDSKYFYIMIQFKHILWLGEMFHMFKKHNWFYVETMNLTYAYKYLF